MVLPKELRDRHASHCDRCKAEIPPPSDVCSFRANTPSGRVICYDCAGKREAMCVNGNYHSRWVCFIQREFLVSYTGTRLLRIDTAEDCFARVDGHPVQGIRIWGFDGHGRRWYGKVWAPHACFGGRITMRRIDRVRPVGRPIDFGDPQKDCG